MTIPDAYMDAYKKGLISPKSDWLEQAIVSCPHRVPIELALTEPVAFENLDCFQPAYKRISN